MMPKDLRRPLSVSLLSDLVLILAVFNLVRAGQALADYSFLQSLLPFSPIYVVATGLFWGLTSLVIAWCFWKGVRAGRWLLIANIGLYSLFYWLDRILMPGYLVRNMNWLYIVVCNLFILGWVIWVCTRPKVKMYFEGTDEQRPEESTTA